MLLRNFFPINISKISQTLTLFIFPLRCRLLSIPIPLLEIVQIFVFLTRFFPVFFQPFLNILQQRHRFFWLLVLDWIANNESFVVYWRTGLYWLSLDVVNILGFAAFLRVFKSCGIGCVQRVLFISVSVGSVIKYFFL